MALMSDSESSDYSHWATYAGMHGNSNDAVTINSHMYMYTITMQDEGHTPLIPSPYRRGTHHAEGCHTHTHTHTPSPCRRGTHTPSLCRRPREQTHSLVASPKVT